MDIIAQVANLTTRDLHRSLFILLRGRNQHFNGAIICFRAVGGGCCDTNELLISGHIIFYLSIQHQPHSKRVIQEHVNKRTLARIESEMQIKMT